MDYVKAVEILIKRKCGCDYSRGQDGSCQQELSLGREGGGGEKNKYPQEKFIGGEKAD